MNEKGHLRIILGALYWRKSWCFSLSFLNIYTVEGCEPFSLFALYSGEDLCTYRKVIELTLFGRRWTKIIGIGKKE